mgnify:CR=1 FL=1
MERLQQQVAASTAAIEAANREVEQAKRDANDAREHAAASSEAHTDAIATAEHHQVGAWCACMCGPCACT